MRLVKKCGIICFNWQYLCCPAKRRVFVQKCFFTLKYANIKALIASELVKLRGCINQLADALRSNSTLQKLGPSGVARSKIAVGVNLLVKSHCNIIATRLCFFCNAVTRERWFPVVFTFQATAANWSEAKLFWRCVTSRLLSYLSVCQVLLSNFKRLSFRLDAFLQGILQFPVVPKVIFEALSENTGTAGERVDLTLGMIEIHWRFSILGSPGSQGELSSLLPSRAFKDSMLEQVRDVQPAAPVRLSIYDIYVYFLQGNDVYKAAAAAFRTNRSLIKLDFVSP